MEDLESKSYLFIIIDGRSCLFTKVQGNVKTELHKIVVDLPRRFGIGKPRFKQHREEKKAEYIKLCASWCHKTCNDDYSWIVLAGCLFFQSCLFDALDSSLQSKVLIRLALVCAGWQGLNDAIETVKDILL
jgi:peptide subunit release factor 1 (eRF1)